MNFVKVYASSIGKESKDFTKQSEQNPDGSMIEDAARFQIKHQWLQSSITKEFINSLIEQFNNSIEQAINLAVTYPEHKNYDKIVHILIRANELKKLINENSQI